MRYTRVARLPMAATCVLPFATPAIAELWQHPSGCLSCARVEVPDPTPGYDHESAPVSAPLHPERHRRHPRRGVAGTSSR